MLNLVPCCAWENSDKDNCKVIKTEENAAADHEDECANCSPFYACGNCLGSSVVSTMLTIQPATISASINFNPIFLSCATEGIVKGIWQPPKSI